MTLTNPIEIPHGKVVLQSVFVASVDLFKYWADGQYKEFPGDFSINLSDNMANHVYLDTVQNEIGVSGSFPVSNRIPLAIIGISSGSLISYEDSRPFLQGDTNLFSAVDLGPSGANLKVDWNDGKLQTVNLNSNTNATFIDPPGPSELTLMTRQDLIGGRLIFWSTNVKFPIGGLSLVTLSLVKSVYKFTFDGSNYLLHTLQSFNI